MNFANTVHYLTGINVEYSPCGRRLEFGLHQTANLAIKSSTFRKIVVVASITFALFAFLYSVNCASMVRTTISLNPISLIDKIAVELFYQILQWAPAFLGGLCPLVLMREIDLQIEEEALARTLGGPLPFHLPYINNIKNEKELRHLKPTDVRYRRITLGFLPYQRFFVVLHIRDKIQPQQASALITLCQKKWSLWDVLPWNKSGHRFTNWEILGHPKDALGGHVDCFPPKIYNLQRLLLGRHPTHELI